MAVDDEAHPHVASGGKIRAKRREHHLGGISRVDFSFNLRARSEIKSSGAAIYRATSTQAFMPCGYTKLLWCNSIPGTYLKIVINTKISYLWDKFYD